jgi:hypothetical protein
MGALAIGGIVFVCVLGGALSGMFLEGVLPKHHLSDKSKDVIRVAMGMLATLSALVIGLLIASANTSFDIKSNEIRRVAANALVLDRMLAAYGPEARDARDLVRQAILAKVRAIWPEGEAKILRPHTIAEGHGGEDILRKISELTPQDDSQRWIKSQALQIGSEIVMTRSLVAQQTGSSIQWPFLTILVFWLTVIFVSFGLFAPRNVSVLAVLFVCALSVAASIYLIVEMDQPYGGLIKLSSAPLDSVLDQLGR